MTCRRRWTWEFDVPRERLWNYVADTDWVNERAGLPPIDVTFEPMQRGAVRRVGRTRAGPLWVQWEERPTIWKAPEFFVVERIYRRGPLARFWSRQTLEPTERGTRVVVEVELDAAWPLAKPLLGVLALRGRRGLNRAFSLAARLAARDAEPAATSSGLGEFAPLTGAGIEPEIVAAMATYFASAQSRDVRRIRPYELADRWQLSRRQTLRAFLAATRLGLFDLMWTVLCPSCRGARPGFESLDDLHRSYHCDACNLTYDPAFDRSVEVTFDARPLGHTAEPALYCLASPQRSAHVYAQAALAPLARERVSLSLPRGSYQLNVAGIGSVPFVASDEEREGPLRVTIDAESGVDAEQSVKSGDATIDIASKLDREAIVRVEEGAWPDTIATAAQVTALADFRDLFSSQVLAPGLEMSIQTLAILFTDLVGSTAIYNRTGDAPAFRIVSDHFDVMHEVVAQHEGSIVKTIGDAVMAVFTDPSKCFQAALGLDERVRPILAGGEPLRLRAGLHAGPCIAMRANDRIDYFGTTVNLAARLQKLAGPGEVTLARSVAELPPLVDMVARLPIAAARETLDLKGFPRRVDVVRVAARA